ncbi:hypothetical protein [Thalassovita sp.]|uniref:hypothetical protein n=1 Tax=Thalassovita sp. TaxID=1979401 RepID=UPI0029DE62CB|nr:hypothetical protein [Thalassovita sp.]
MIGFLTRLRKALSQARYSPVVQRAESPMDAVRLAYWVEKKPLRMDLPVSMLRSHGAFRYGPDHPFQVGMRDGKAGLARFFDGFQPVDLRSMYGLSRGCTGAELPQWTLPWRLRAENLPPPGEKGLPASQGTAFYGPCSAAKVALEHRRLAGVLRSIQRKGYNPDRHGDIEGYLLTDGTRACFFVMGGKHRAAALAQMGHSHVPVRLRPGLLSVIDARSLADWPMVVSGQVSPETARAVLEVYLAGRGMADVLG